MTHTVKYKRVIAFFNFKKNSVNLMKKVCILLMWLLSNLYRVERYLILDRICTYTQTNVGCNISCLPESFNKNISHPFFTTKKLCELTRTKIEKKILY